jgi:formate hydrogenlyase subunit 6/NADH:ubiquinone oxidoreductase subunit I
METSVLNEARYLSHNNFPALFSLLNSQGYRIIGPVVNQNQSILYEELEVIEDLPLGWTDEQSPGKYRLFRDDNRYYFNFNCSPQSWKRYLNPPKQKLFSGKRTSENGFELTPEVVHPEKLAFFGMKACELSAVNIQDKVFVKGDFKDKSYQIRRENILRIAVDCLKSSNTCFCTSMGQGPGAEHSFDLALSELQRQSTEAEHRGFLLRAGTKLGSVLLEQLQLPLATEALIEQAKGQVNQVKSSISRKLDTQNIKQNLFSARNSETWEKVAAACLSCANCTMACPTCFCSSVEDITNLSGENTERWKRWDSCFTGDFSYVHGGATRQSVSSRYRQWATHKLSYWYDQFGESGCVGCGRCIAWCPVGIDLTQVANELQQEAKSIPEANFKKVTEKQHEK